MQLGRQGLRGLLVLVLLVLLDLRGHRGQADQREQVLREQQGRVVLLAQAAHNIRGKANG